MNCKQLATSEVCFTPTVGSPVTLTAHYEYREGAGGAARLHAVRFTDAQGVVVNTAGGTLAVGVCPVPVVAPAQEKVFPGGTNIAGGSFAATHDPNGNGAGWSWSPTAGGSLQALTVTALEAGLPASGNGVRVRFGAVGGELWLVKGQSFTWSVAQHSANVAEVLDPEIDVGCFGNSAANLIWTEE